MKEDNADATGVADIDEALRPVNSLAEEEEKDTNLAGEIAAGVLDTRVLLTSETLLGRIPIEALETRDAPDVN